VARDVHRGRSIGRRPRSAVRRIAPVGLGLRAPTPKLLTSVAGTTLTSCPASLAASATRNASAAVSTITRDRGSSRKNSGNECVLYALEEQPSSGLRTHTWDFLHQIDRTMVHGWFLLLAPRARKSLSDGNRQLSEEEPATSSSLDGTRRVNGVPPTARSACCRAAVALIWIDVTALPRQTPWKARRQRRVEEQYVGAVRNSARESGHAPGEETSSALSRGPLVNRKSYVGFCSGRECPDRRTRPPCRCRSRSLPTDSVCEENARSRCPGCRTHAAAPNWRSPIDAE